MRKIFRLMIVFSFIIALLPLKNVQATEIQEDALTSELEGKTIEINSVITKQIDENGKEKILNYFEYLDDKVVNSIGEEVFGNYKFSDNIYSPIFGYNYITYTFYPSNLIPTEKQYKEFSGMFIVKFTKKPIIETFSNKLILNLSINNYRVMINGKRYTKKVVTNLKPNTKYKIIIYQKKNDYMKETLLWKTTVKTKSK